MKFWDHVIAKPTLWIASGVVLGAFAMASFITSAKSNPAFADPQTKRSVLASSLSSSSIDTLRALDDSFSSLVDLVGPAVVHIRTEMPGGTDTSGKRVGRVVGEGSGVIIRPDGWILTNDHVVAGFEKVTVVLNDGRELPGTVRRAKDLQNDVAVVKVEGKDLPTARFADSSKVKPGQFAIAIGAPFGLENTVTVGHVSGLGRTSGVFDPRVGERGYTDMIQTDAPINPGNSGGPLLNIEGEIIGINTTILGGSSMLGGQGTNVGIGFAIPSNQAKLIGDLLIEKGKVERGYMGLAPANLKPFELKEKGIAGGAVVLQVPAQGPAAQAGIKENDIVTRIGTYPVNNQQELRNAMFHYQPGQTVTIELLRGTEKKKVDLKVAKLPDNLVSKEYNPNQGGNNPLGDLQLPDNMKEFWGDAPKGNGNGSEDTPKTGRAKLGVSVGAITPDARKEFSIPESAKGAVVGAVTPGSVAEKLGLKEGDVIESINGKSVDGPEALVNAMKNVDWGSKGHIKYTRFGKGVVSVDRDFIFE